MTDPYFRSLPLFPNYGFGDERIDRLVPACHVESWETFIEAMRSPDHKAKSELSIAGRPGMTGICRPRWRGLDVGSLAKEEVWAF